MVKPHESLTQAAVSAYGNRKESGRLALLVNIRDGRIYPVPREIEHVDFIGKLDNSSENYVYFMSCYVDLEQNPIDGLEKVLCMSTGHSGVELKLKVKHPKKYYDKAQDILKQFVKTGEFESDDAESKIDYSFATDSRL